MSEDYHLDLAMDMIGGDQAMRLHLNVKLEAYLNSVAMLCRRAGGNLVSRQAIAVAIKSWQDMNPGKTGYGDNNE